MHVDQDIFALGLNGLVEVALVVEGGDVGHCEICGVVDFFS